MGFASSSARLFHGYSFVEILWEFTPDSGVVDAAARIEVTRSEQEHGPFTHRGEVDALDYRFEDPMGKARGGRHTWYYRLVLRRPGMPATISRVFSDVRFASKQQEYVFAGILARQMNQLRHRSGAPCLLYRRIVDGPPCPECVDRSTGQHVGTSRCETCWGTGIAGGYAAPVSTYVQKVAAENFTEKVSDDLPRSIKQENVFVTPALPRIYPGDLFIFSTRDERYHVDPDIKLPAMLGRHPLEHGFRAEKIPIDSVIYKMPVPEGW